MSNPNEHDLDLQNDTDLLSELDPNWQSAPVGASVVANDGKTIGTIKEKNDDGLFVESAVAGEDEFFVTAADIGTVDSSGVKLVIAASEVMRARPESAADDASAQSQPPS